MIPTIRTFPKFLLAALVTTTAQAQAAVVPAPPLPEATSGFYQTQVSVLNLSGAEQAFWSSDLDGSQGPARATRLRVAAGQTATVKLKPGSYGLLELAGDTSLRYEAHVSSPGIGRLDLPVLTSENIFRGGQTLSLQGLFASESTATNLAFVSLARTASRCSLALTTADGVPMGPAVTVTMEAMENRPYLDVFERLIESYGITQAQATISCTGDFYAFALLADRSTGRLELVTPIQQEPLVVAAALEACPAGATCLDAPGLVFIPAPPPGQPVGRVSFPAPGGVVKRFRLSLDVTVGPWAPREPSGKHLIYWFVINKNPDMPGLLYFRGPGKDQAFARHGVKLTHPQKIKIIKPFTAQVGRTYHVVNDYDMARGSYTVKITDAATGELAVTLSGRPNVASYTNKPGSKYIVDVGFPPGLVPTEVPSYGWKYSDVHIETYLR